MSTASYKRKPNATRTVKYSYIYRGKWKHGEHVCFEKTDDGAIKSCYDSVLITWLPEFHITEIVTEIN